jgi:hypothetical protein
MIIDFMSECTSIVRCSYFDSMNAGVLDYNYTIKKASDMLSWKITNPSVSAVEFVIISSEVKTLKDLQLELVGFQDTSTIVTKVETSLDYINWYEPVYKSDDKYLYLRTSSPNGEYYFNLTDPNNGKDTSLDNNLLIYSFKKYDENTKETTYIYNNFEFKFIKISLSNLTLTEGDVGRFKTFNISIEDAFNTQALNNNLLEIKSGMFTQQKVFETEEFVPDMFKNYFKMIDEGNTNTSTLLYSNPRININPFATNTQGDGIGNDLIDIDTIIY